MRVTYQEQKTLITELNITIVKLNEEIKELKNRKPEVEYKYIRMGEMGEYEEQEQQIVTNQRVVETVKYEEDGYGDEE